MVAPKSLLKGFEKTVATIKPDPKKRLAISDPDTRGLYLRVTPGGHKSYVVVARDPAGKQIWATIGGCDDHTLAQARELAGEGVRRIRKGLEAFPKVEPEKAPETFKAVAERFVVRWVDKGGKKQDGVPLRSKREIERQFKKYVYPKWEDKPFLSIRRGAVTELVDGLVDNSGPVQADRVLATLAKLFNWYRQYDEGYVNPIIPEMKRSGSHVARARHRILTDDEMRTIWTASDKIGTFGALVKLALLSGQRRAKVAAMKWDDLTDGVWTIAAEQREKVNAGRLKLPRLALDVIAAQPKIEGNPYVFSGRGKKAYASFSDGKEDLHAVAPIEPWVIHDLRRTAKSLMARAGVRPDISERALGHVVRGVEGVYDRYDYFDEKGEALEKLAGLVALIIDPPADNVVTMKGARNG